MPEDILFNGMAIIQNVGKYHFKDPVKFLYTVNHDFSLCLTYEPLGLYAIGSTWKGLYKDLENDLDELWNCYIDMPDDRLHSSGLKLKEKAKSMLTRGG